MSEAFSIGVGNIQGLRGSPLRSVIFLDMLLKWLERTTWGYTFTTSRHYTDKREHKLDNVKAHIPGLSWIDDFILFAPNMENAKEIMNRLNKFLSYYRMRLTFDKCEHHIRTAKGEYKKFEPIKLTDFKGNTNTIRVYNKYAPIKLLGTTSNLVLKFDRQNELTEETVTESEIKLSSGWSPANMTARLANTDVLSKFTHTMATADLMTNTITKIQSMMAKSVWKDGRYTRQVPYEAFIMADSMGGHNLAKVNGVYQSLKISTLCKSLNSGFWLLCFTTQATLLDLKRHIGSRNAPMEEGKMVHHSHKRIFPPYMITAGNFMAEHNLRLREREDVILRDITINTALGAYTEDIPNLRLAITMLGNQNIVFMSQISNWFKPTYNLGTKKVSYAELVTVEHNLELIYGNNHVQPELMCFNGKGVVKYGEACHNSLLAAMDKLKRDLVTDPTFIKHVPLSIRQLVYKSNLKQGKYTNFLKGATSIVTDGSFDVYASFGIAISAKREGVASSIPNRQTPQRGELFGLLAATANADSNAPVIIAADPLPIIKTINRGLTQEIQWYDWPKIKNRNIIKAIIEAARGKKNKITYQWIEGHKKTNLNDLHKVNHKADRAAKTKSKSFSMWDLEEPWVYADQFAMVIDGELYDGNIRKQLNKRIHEKYIQEFTLSNQGERFSKDGQWYNEEWEGAIRNKLDHNIERFVFLVKAKGLMTHDKMRKYNNELYEEVTCPTCEQMEDGDVHTFTNCIGNIQDRTTLWQEIVSTIANASNIKEEQVRKEITRWIPYSRNHADNMNETWFTAALPLTFKSAVEKWNNKGEDKREVYVEVKVAIIKAAYEIWIKRCDINAEKFLNYKSRLVAQIEELEFMNIGYEEGCDLNTSYYPDD